jgi:hypothetical protein
MSEMGWLPAYDVNAAAPGLSFLITWRVLVLLLVLQSLFTHIHSLSPARSTFSAPWATIINRLGAAAYF